MRASEQACVESRMCKMERSSEWANENANASVCLKLRVSQEIKNACECGLLDVTLTHIHSLSLSLSGTSTALDASERCFALLSGFVGE